MEITYRSGSAALLWKTAVHRVYLLSGTEDRFKEEAVEAFLTRFTTPDFADFDVETLNAESASAEAILSAAGQMPFGSEKRVVIVRGMEQWRDRGRQAEADRLAEGLARLPESACLILVVAAEEEEARRKTAVSPRFDAAVKKIGALALCQALSADSLVDWVVEQFRSEGKEISRDTATALTDAAGSEMRALQQEILKLVFYVGERDVVTSREVTAVVAGQPEDVMFQAIEAITKRQTDRALGLLSELHRHDPKPQAVAGKLLALLARQYRMLWQAKFLAAKGVSPRDVRSLPQELAAELPTEGHIAQLAFKAGDLFTQSRQYAWTDLQHAFERLLLCDLANKGGVTSETETFGSDPVSNLQLLVFELAAARGQAAGRG